MKKLFISIILSLTVVMQIGAQVSFQFSDGIYNENLKTKVETSVSALLTEINKAESQNRSLNLYSIRMTDQAREGLNNLWSNLHFRCEDIKNVQPCLKDVIGYEIRQIRVHICPIDNTYKGELEKELTISFNSEGSITGVRTALDNNSYASIIAGGKGVQDTRMRREILKFVEDFRSYYEEKNLSALDNIFSDDALIITGRVIKSIGKSQADGITQQVKEKIVYSKQNKESYIRNLGALFKNNKYIKVDFSDIELMRHGSKANFYGVRLRQKWDSQRYNGKTYGDDGYIFLLWDFNDESNPKIHVRTWTPKTNSLDDEDFLTPEDFFIP